MSKRKTAKKRAPKAAPLTPSKAKSGKWVLNVPPSKSETGERQRLYFTTKGAAEIEAERIKGMAERWGSEGRKIKADLATDAAKSAEALEQAGFDTTLHAVIKEWLEIKEAESQSIGFSDLCEIYKDTKEKEDVSLLYLRDIERFLSPFINAFGSQVVSSIRHHEVREILQALPSTRQQANAYRTVRPVFSMAVVDGYASENPFDKIKVPKHNSQAPEAISIAEVKALFNACTDYRKKKKLAVEYRLDASDAAAAFAIMVFAGVRPEEIKRLQWEKVHLDDRCIIIDSNVSKTRSHRVIDMSENLIEWLESVPADERTGPVVPNNWMRKYRLVRKTSGIAKRQQDILRHSFASYHLSAHSDFNALQSCMGHGTSEMILKHYKALVRKPDAVKFWSITPKSTGAKIKAVA